MRFADGQTLKDYDNFKSEMFGDKAESYKEKYRQKVKKHNGLSDSVRPINHPFLRQVLFSSLLFASSVYVASKIYEYYPSIKTKFQPRLNSYDRIISSYSWRSVLEDFKNRFHSLGNKHRISEQKLRRFANEVYLESLRKDLCKIETKLNTRLINQQIRSSLSMGPINVKNQQESLFVDELGNVMKQVKSSFIKFGDLSCFGRRNQSVIKYSDILQVYFDIENYPNDSKCCERANWVNKVTLSNQQYESVLAECKTSSDELLGRIKAAVSKNKSEANKYGNDRKIYLFS